MMRTFELKVGGRYVPLGRMVLLAEILTAVGGVALVVGAKWFVASEVGREFLARFPAVPDRPPVPEGFPPFVRLAHFFNFLLMVFIVRSGLQILADHPRLYTNIHSTPDTEWLRFRGPMPRDRFWTAKDDAIRVPGWLGIPGGRHTIGLARHWHFFMDILFVVNGVIFVALNFATGVWVRLVPVSWEIIPQAFSGFILYSSLQDPSALAGVSGFERYNALQQVTYFGVIFVLAPLAILTGIAMSPAFDNRFKWYQRMFGNRQIARSIHFLIMCAFVLFFVVHLAMVAMTGLFQNLNHITLGTNDTGLLGFWIALAGIAFVVFLSILANPLTWK